jgi:hypothetical protein
MRAVAQLLAGRGGEEVLSCGALRLRLEMVVDAVVVAFYFSAASLVEGRSCRGVLCCASGSEMELISGGLRRHALLPRLNLKVVGQPLPMLQSSRAGFSLAAPPQVG